MPRSRKPRDLGHPAEGRQVTVNNVQTTFDAVNRAVQLNNNGVYTQVVYAPSGQKFAFMSGSTLIKYIDAMVAGMAAIHNGDGSGYFQHADWLGSSWLGVDGGGNPTYDHAYAPFGEDYNDTNNTNLDFTGQTQDTTPGIYDFLLRQYSPSQGRWLVPDPAGMAAVDITNPQTWNRYAYVGNNPLNAVDPLGLVMSQGCTPFTCDWDDGGGGYTDTGYCPPSYQYCGDPGGGGGYDNPPEVGGGGDLSNFPNGESLGIPHTLRIRNWGIWGAIIPTDQCGDITCFLAGMSGTGTSRSLWTFYVLALARALYQGKGSAAAANNGQPQKPLTPQQKQCLSNAAQDYDTAVQRAHQDANHTWWVDIRNSVGGGAVGGCVVGAIGGEGVGCLPGGAIGALGGWLWGVPAGLWDASNQLDAATARAQEDYQTAQQRCIQ